MNDEVFSFEEQPVADKPSKKKQSSYYASTVEPLHPAVDLERWMDSFDVKEYMQRLANEMTALGLVTREDFFSQTGQQRLVKAAFAAARLDAPTIMGLLKEIEDDGS